MRLSKASIERIEMIHHDPVLDRIESIIERINFNVILDEINLWKSLENPDMIDAMAIINKTNPNKFTPSIVFLAKQVKEAVKLIQLCKDKIEKAEMDVKNVVESLQKKPG